MYFPAADITANPVLLPAVALLVSFFCSMGGISGAFLLLPFQVSYLGYVNPSVSATNQFYNVVAIPTGVYRYVREGRMVWPLAMTVAVGTLPGVMLGALIRILYLPDPRTFKLFAGLVLAYIGMKLLLDLRKGNSGNKGALKPATPAAGQGHGATGAFVTDVSITLRRIQYTYQGEVYACPMVSLFALSLVIGLVGGCYGIGGGAIMAPILVSWYRLPVHTLGGATLLGTFLTSVAGIAFYSFIAPFFPGQSVAPDWMLGFLLGIGGLVGMYFGARCQKHVPAAAIKWMLCAVILATAGQYVAGFFR
ncbi:sulfite exporter TauE/SafE family protein [Desulfovibrio cuneatus]|uniref:sulfite exporter TauE/SafE family protein n=1 Tax=Desulfovibrio cuneatus TaxID=159728 RepID=UPI000422DD00|nr:sulfite exporter TauE/SafE family protein [Desulfovibrio cuneatus]